MAADAGVRAAVPLREVRPSTPADAPAIVALMRTAGLVPHVDPEHLHWKYWRTRTDCDAPRSFVLTDGRELLAHGAAMPGVLRAGGTRVGAIHMIDWAARRDAVGAGVQLMKHVGALTDCLFAIGGSAATLRILPRIGYRRCGDVFGYVRTLSPLALLRRPAAACWKLTPRFVRSAVWTWSARRPATGGWHAWPVSDAELDRIAALRTADNTPLPYFERSRGFLHHMLACPIVPVELHAIARAGRIHGYFVLSLVPGQARLADWWIDSDVPADRRALLGLAVRRARAIPGVAELVTWSSVPEDTNALSECGFHERLRLPLYIRASAGGAPPTDRLRVQMLDNDAFYLYFDHDELWA